MPLWALVFTHIYLRMDSMSAAWLVIRKRNQPHTKQVLNQLLLNARCQSSHGCLLIEHLTWLVVGAENIINLLSSYNRSMTLHLMRHSVYIQLENVNEGYA